MKIKFGTDGWRAIIADSYTVENVRRVSLGTAAWMKSKGMSKVVIGYDCRFAGFLFAKEAARVYCEQGIAVMLDEQFASTPMVSLGVVKLKADLGVVITASHNPPSYNGYKLKSSFGGPTIPRDIAAVEALVPDSFTGNPEAYDKYKSTGKVEIVDLETMYANHVLENFDLESIRKANFKLAYDAMYGAGQRILPRLLPEAHCLHCTFNPSFEGQAPEPIHRNLGELSHFLASAEGDWVGLANDGDADRIGMYDHQGNFVDSHHLLLLLLYYMHEFKQMTGKVVITFSVTDKMKKLAEKYGLVVEVTKIGFKYIAEIMTQEDVLVGGEESGGLAVKGHIPERDGIWMGLLIMEFMAKKGKSLRELIDEVYALVGPFAFDRDDLHITNTIKADIIANCKAGKYQSFGEMNVEKSEQIDGYKYYFNEDEWLMIRPSGTEPVLRVYCQAPNATRVRAILDMAKATLLPA